MAWISNVAIMADSIEPTITSAYRSVGVTFDALVCENEKFREALRLAASVAAKDVNTLLLGETGTGKNLIAQAIHNASARAKRPFVSVNCSAIPDSLLEAELFGSEKGAYTSAEKLRRGKFELADGGTLFLDEIGDMSAVAQAKVLRAFEYKQFERVGGEETLHTDVRIIAATNRPVEELLGGGSNFREDLFYRMNEFTIDIPPLRERKEEIPPLVEQFIRECNERFGCKIRGLASDAMNLLMQHNWPGNVRELRAVIKRATVACTGDIVEPSNMKITTAVKPETATQDPSLPLSEVEAKHIESVLNANAWNKKESSRILGISRPTLDRKINEYRISKD
ncbi:MAG: sigma-54 interaction domain-containing protein [Planctomycetota bacterium]|jgi:transcriptional regulator with PAS, ATPase and Fis domain